MALTGDVIRVATLDPLEPEWLELWHAVEGTSPFDSPLWLLPWWRGFGRGDARVLTVRDDGRLVGILPLYCVDTPDGPALLPIGAGVSDYQDGLASTPAVAERLLAGLAALEADGIACVLPALSPDSLLGASAGPAAWRDEGWAGEACPVLRLPDRLDDLADTVPRPTLRNLRQAEARARRRGDVQVETARPDEIEATLESLFALHARRWEERGAAGVLADPEVQRFHQAVAPGLAHAGVLRLYRLRFDDRVVGVYLGFVAKRRAFAYIGGFDPAFPRESPGAILIGHAIRAAIAEGATEFHFLRGREPYKYAWGAVDRINRGRRLTPPSVARAVA